MKNSVPSLLTALIIFLQLAGCAGQRPPEGGPLDLEPPSIVSTYPAPNTIQFADTKIALEFDEYIDRRSLEESIFISPSPGELEYNWSGTEVEIVFVQPLKKNTTYVVTIGSDVVDINNRNRMAQSQTIAFSTGVTIDNGAVEGQVFDERPAGVMIFAYKLDNINRDTLNPSISSPDYITQSGSDGKYSLTHLAYGYYRIFAIRDEYRNLLYDPEIDAAGTAVSDFHISADDTLHRGINFELAQEDTTHPRLLTAAAPDNSHLDLAFSEPIDSSSLAISSFAISDTSGIAPLPIRYFFQHADKPSMVTLVTAKQDSGFFYSIKVLSLRDVAGLPINPLADSVIFSGAGQADTTAPKILSAAMVDSLFIAQPRQQFFFDFDDALDTAALTEALRLMAADSVFLPSITQLTAPSRVTFFSVDELKINARYFLQIYYHRFTDLCMNHAGDSVRTIPFRTIDPESFGSIEFSVIDEQDTSANRYLVTAGNVLNRKEKPLQKIVPRNTKSSFIQLKEGVYGMKVVQKKDSAGKQQTGRLFPFIPSERFTYLQDTLKVRARWPIEGIQIRLK